MRLSAMQYVIYLFLCNRSPLCCHTLQAEDGCKAVCAKILNTPRDNYQEAQLLLSSPDFTSANGGLGSDDEGCVMVDELARMQAPAETGTSLQANVQKSCVLLLEPPDFTV